MKDLKKLYEECLADIESLGIEVGDIKDVTVNTRAANRWGQCRYRSGYYYINISERLLADDVDDQSTKDTIAHEILHTIKGGMKHTGAWKESAQLLNDLYGYNIHRCSSAEEKGVEVQPRVRNYKYIITCNTCGTIFKYQKDCRIVKLIRKGYTGCRCPKCGNHTFTLEEN